MIVSSDLKASGLMPVTWKSACPRYMCGQGDPLASEPL